MSSTEARGYRVKLKELVPDVYKTKGTDPQTYKEAR